MSQQLLISNRHKGSNSFCGYVFKGDELFHSEISVPNLQDLLSKYEENCGVFLASLQDGDILRIFTDPLGQFPVFYYTRGSDYVVGQDFFEVINNIPTVEINHDCVTDYVTYFSPLNQETLVRSVRRLKPFESIEIHPEGMKILRRYPFVDDAPYESLVKHAASRIRGRARALLRSFVPVAHLSGGMDCRLSVASLIAEGFKGSVFSFGNGRSEDRLISHEIANKFGMTEAGRRWYNAPLKTIPDMKRALRRFNGMKVINMTNFGVGQPDYSYSEVTGYFSEGLLKGFGRVLQGTEFVMFSYGRKTSSLPEEAFERPNIRAETEFRSILDDVSGHTALANCLHYLQNRSPGHFGMHSVVTNKKCVSIDLIYDPFLLNLVRKAPYNEAIIRDGAIILDLTKQVHTPEFATFPYDNRTLFRHAEWTHAVKSPSCFEPYAAAQIDLDALPVTNFSSEAGLPGPAVSEAEDHLAKILSDYPLLHTTRNGTRAVELVARKALLCLLDDLLSG